MACERIHAIKRYFTRSLVFFLACSLMFQVFAGYARSDDSPAAASKGQPEGSDDTSFELPAVQVEGKTESQNNGSAESGYRYKDVNVGPLGSAPIQDTPYSVNVTSGELIDNTAAHTEYEALKTNPAVSSLMDSNSYSSMSRIMIRGFSAADQDDMRNGLVDRSFTFVPLDNVDRIVVLNGLSGFFYGFTEPGGYVNYITKQPPPCFAASVETGVYNGGIFYGREQVGGPVPETGDKLSFLFTAAEEGGSTYLENSNESRQFFSGVLKYQLTSNTVLTADVWHQYFSLDGLQSYINVNTAKGIGVPPASLFDPTKQYGQPWTYDHAEKTVAGLSMDSKLSDIFTLRTAFSYGDMWRDYRYVDATLTNSLGKYTETTTATPIQHETTFSRYALMDADFDTWVFKQHLTFGYTGTEFYFRRGTDVTSKLGPSDITDPVSYDAPAVTLGLSNQYTTQDLNNVVVGDRIELNSKVSVLGGGTFATYYGRTGVENLVTTDLYQTAVTPSGAFIYKPIPNITTYFSYIQGLTPGSEAPSTYNGKPVVNADQFLPATMNEQYEIGSKATFGKLDFSVALFDILVVNDYVDPTDLVFKANGLEEHKGIEFYSTGKIDDDLSVVGGCTFLRARVENTASISQDDKIPVDVPEQQVRLYFEYVLPFARKFTFSAGGFYDGRRPVDNLNEYFMSDSVTFDLGLRYKSKVMGHDLSVIFNVKNIGDTSYWSYYRSGDGLFLGEPRTFNLALKAGW